MNEWDDLADEWPNDDEANDIMLAYAADEEGGRPGSGTGCAGAVLTFVLFVFAMVWAAFALV